jgi:hypothetical protein
LNHGRNHPQHPRKSHFIWFVAWVLPWLGLLGAAHGEHGWHLAETENFRIHYLHHDELAGKVGETAERMRAEVERRWFGAEESTWRPPCDIFLFATSTHYSAATGLPETLPGYSTIAAENARVLRRRIDLNCSNGDVLEAILPHEVTHIVLWSRLGEKNLPPWANEGMAVLTEPRDRIDRHLHNLPYHQREGQTLELRRLMNLKTYPEQRDFGAFYAQSVSVVQFLVQRKDPKTFVAFLKESLHHGYDAALARHYQLNFDELETSWQQHFCNNQEAVEVSRAPAQGGSWHRGTRRSSTPSAAFFSSNDRITDFR